ncbi:hypothetical protein GDO78_005182 [Eleutherodactylus coqui]|uniref:Uncharacterized protein n=1 Tax=Eleutherodactylus coqui TaxID=57060 RepID=A0A8J6FJC4_ELECQ|nr:hypothetical protein GDO78_005182 [Eleutherodactylus coqui]
MSSLPTWSCKITIITVIIICSSVTRLINVTDASILFHGQKNKVLYFTGLFRNFWKVVKPDTGQHDAVCGDMAGHCQCLSTVAWSVGSR